MTSADVWADLERLAKAANDRTGLDAAVAATVPGWEKNDTAYKNAVSAHHSRQNAFRAAANPATVLALIAAARASAVGIGAADETKSIVTPIEGEGHA